MLRRSVGGYARHVLHSDRIEVEVVPELGGKVIGLRDRARGREWLWSAKPDAPLFRNQPGDPFDTGTLCGLDECLPTVGPCEVSGKHLPDHGEAWSRPWRVVEESGHRSLTLELELRCLPLRIQRQAVVERDGVRFTYELRNVSPEPVEYLWAIHPLFRFAAGDRIELPDESAIFRVDSAFGIPGIEPGATIAWPGQAHGLSLDRLDLNHPKSYLKGFVSSPPNPKLRVLGNRDGACKPLLEMQYGPRELLPHLGIWVTRGGWEGHHHYALEPSNAAYDRLSDAIDHSDPALRIPGGATRNWYVSYVFL